MDLPGLCSTNRTRSIILGGITGITGITLLVTGAVLISIFRQYIALGFAFYIIPLVVVLLGCLIIISIPLGYYMHENGSIRQVRNISSILTIVVLSVEVLAVIGGFVFNAYIYQATEIILQLYITLYSLLNYVVPGLDPIHSNFRCCGVFSYRDWNKHFKKEYFIPASCCDKLVGSCYGSPNLYQAGCLEKFGDFLSGLLIAMSVVVLVCFVIQVITAIVARLFYPGSNK